MLDNDANKELFMEQMEIIFKAFNEESFTHEGKHYTLPAQVPYRGYDLKDITLVPRPVHRPVDVWQPIASRRTLRYIAQTGIKGVVHGTGEKLVDQVFHEYRDAASEAGRGPGFGRRPGSGLILLHRPGPGGGHDQGPGLPRREVQVVRSLRPGALHRRRGPALGNPRRSQPRPTLEDGVDQKVWLCGDSDYVVEALKDFESKYPGLEHVILHWPEGMPLAEYPSS